MARFAGHKLAEARKQCGLSREQLAVISGVPLGSLTRYEQQRAAPGINNGFALAGALGVQVDAFMDGGAGEPETGDPSDLPTWAQQYIRQLRAEAAAHRARARDIAARNPSPVLAERTPMSDHAAMSNDDELCEWIGENVVVTGFQALEKMTEFEAQLQDQAAGDGPRAEDAQTRLAQLARARERLTEALGSVTGLWATGAPTAPHLEAEARTAAAALRDITIDGGTGEPGDEPSP